MQVDEWTVTLTDGRQVGVSFGGGHWSLWPIGWTATWHVDEYRAVTDVNFGVGEPLRFTAIDEDDLAFEEPVVLPVVTGVSTPKRA